MGGTQLKENGTMNWLAQIRQMKNRDIRTIEQSELQELQQDAVEHGLPQEERLKKLLIRSEILTAIWTMELL